MTAKYIELRTYNVQCVAISAGPARGGDIRPLRVVKSVVIIYSRIPTKNNERIPYEQAGMTESRAWSRCDCHNWQAR
ncbi:hypothetical protein N7517_003899 [Penicillium concentricum]|uniref:Uncharacterized protein n=1 Tax=Penicillium concentricum TaxID=293559 RepID=A0A9W9S972_9EURO|nr:uncharacterized protein N7517_003899 [Penicillium concentricum]KAJ5371893.1 hypothetical protein N7517_003899 [Penicillium concentricum]